MGGNHSCFRQARRFDVLQTLSLTELYGPLLDKEKELRDTIIRSYNATLDETTRQHITLVGSLAEGSFLCRHFGLPRAQQEHQHEIEFDSMWNVGEVADSDAAEAMVVPVANNEGFFSIRGEEFMQHCRTFNQDGINKTMATFYESEMIKNSVISGQFIDASSIRLLQRIWIGQNRARIPHYPRSAALASCLAAPCPILGPCTRVQIINDENGPCSKTETWMFAGGKCTKKRHYRMLVDNVLYVTIPWPRSLAAAFKNRTRKWPSAEEIDKVTHSKCQLVPKSDNAPVQWRLSLSEAEMEYRTLYGRNRDLAFLAFKSTYYRHVFPVQYKVQENGTDEDQGDKNLRHFGSYLAKTTMMWLCADTTDEDWEEGKLSERHSDLCDRLRQALETGFLPHFFMPSVNLLKNISEDARLKAASQLPNDPPSDVALCITKATHLEKKLSRLPSNIRGRVTLTYEVLGNLVQSLSPTWRNDENDLLKDVLYDTDDHCCCSYYSSLLCACTS